MKKQIVTTLIILFASNAHSQIMVEWAGQFKWGSGSGAHITKYWVPLAEKEVENGNLKSFKSLGHSMGDEWNSVDLYVADDYETWSKAWDNMISGWRKNAPQEERQKHFSNLMAHKDNIYSVAHSKQSNKNGSIYVAWYGKIDYVDLPDYLKHAKKYFFPIWDKKVDDGELNGYTVLTHAWGDEWTLVIHYEAKDIPSFQKTWSSVISEYGDKVSKSTRDKFQRMITDHKDNIYSIRASK